MATRNPTNSPVEGQVDEIPLFTRVWDTSKRWLGMGFLNQRFAESIGLTKNNKE